MNINMSLSDFCNLISISNLEERRQGSENGILYRVDSPTAYKNQQYHIHVGDYAWNIDGSRSHSSRWPNHEPTRRQKQVAANHLGISIDILEQYINRDYSVEGTTTSNNLRLLLENESF